MTSDTTEINSIGLWCVTPQVRFIYRQKASYCILYNILELRFKKTRSTGVHLTCMDLSQFCSHGQSETPDSRTATTGIRSFSFIYQCNKYMFTRRFSESLNQHFCPHLRGTSVNKIKMLLLLLLNNTTIMAGKRWSCNNVNPSNSSL